MGNIVSRSLYPECSQTRTHTHRKCYINHQYYVCASNIRCLTQGSQLHPWEMILWTKEKLISNYSHGKYFLDSKFCFLWIKEKFPQMLVCIQLFLGSKNHFSACTPKTNTQILVKYYIHIFHILLSRSYVIKVARINETIWPQLWVHIVTIKISIWEYCNSYSVYWFIDKKNMNHSSVIR